MRTDTKPFDDIRVRRALNMAVDRQAIVKSYYGGNAEILANPAAPIADHREFYTPLDKLTPSTRELYEHNPEKAKQPQS